VKDNIHAENSSVTSAQRALRVEDVLAFILNVSGRHDRVLDFCTDPAAPGKHEPWSVKDRCAVQYSSDALALHGKLTEPQRDTERGKTRRHLSYLMQKAIEDIEQNGLTNVNVTAFCKAMDTRMKLFGLAAPEIVEHQVPDRWRELFREFGIRGSAAEGEPGNGDARKTAH